MPTIFPWLGVYIYIYDGTHLIDLEIPQGVAGTRLTELAIYRYVTGGLVPIVKKIDEKFLPDVVATKEYVDNLILGALGGYY